jgi:SAM-dependent methyltransferase
MKTDKTELRYWDSSWVESPVSESVNPALPGLNNLVNRRLHEWIARHVAGIAHSARVLEIGCGCSAWLPYFNLQYGFEVTGVDYSPAGCEGARRTLAAAGVSGEVVQCDFREPPAPLRSAFDIVFSFGVIEHFTDTATALRACAAYLKPGGIIITLVPNMNGIPGWMQRWLDRKIFDIHVPLDFQALTRAHATAGLDVVACEYLLFINLNVVNAEGRRQRWFYRPFVRVRSWVSKSVWILEDAFVQFPVNRLTSPYVGCVALRQQ